jgi:hypothetical protein
MSDVFDTVNETGQQGIRVRRGKHNQSRIVVLSGWNSWALEAIEACNQVLGLNVQADPGVIIFVG